MRSRNFQEKKKPCRIERLAKLGLDLDTIIAGSGVAPSLPPAANQR
jgi:hypothetical protein